MEEPRELGEKNGVDTRPAPFYCSEAIGSRVHLSDPNHWTYLEDICATFGGHWSPQISFCEKPKSAPINDVSNTRPARLDPTLPAVLYPSLDRSRHIRHQKYSTRGPVPMKPLRSLGSS